MCVGGSRCSHTPCKSHMFCKFELKKEKNVPRISFTRTLHIIVIPFSQRDYLFITLHFLHFSRSIQHSVNVVMRCNNSTDSTSNLVHLPICNAKRIIFFLSSLINGIIKLTIFTTHKHTDETFNPFERLSLSSLMLSFSFSFSVRS